MSRVIIIGGGPAGLITLYYFKNAHRFFPGIRPFQVKLFEAESEIGGTFKYRAYRSAELVSSKFLTSWSQWRVAEDAPDFLSAEEYTKYLDDFVRDNGLASNIQCRTKVVKVIRSWSKHGSRPEHIVTTQTVHDGYVDVGGDYKENGWTDQTVEHKCDVLVVCSGLNVNPNIPKNIPGLVVESYADGNREQPFQLMHSMDFKNKEGDENEFRGKKTVVVLGAGETGHDVAQLAVTHRDVKRVVLCHRDGFFVAPKIVPWPLLFGHFGKRSERQGPNKPIDTTIASLFDTAYVHPLLQKGQLLWEYYDKWVKAMFWVISGTTVGLDQWAGGIGWNRRHIDSVFAVKTDKAMPYISAPFRGSSRLWPLNWLRSKLINIEIRKTDPSHVIELASWPSRVEAGVMEFENNGSQEARRLELTSRTIGPVRPDLVIMATGYRKTFPFLGDDYPSLKHARVRGIYREIQDGLGYIGFVRPAIGAIPPLAELQAQLFVLRWVQYQDTAISESDPESFQKVLNRTFRYDNTVAPYDLDYVLHARGTYNFASTKGGVDHESYAYQLALDMNAAPTASHVWRTFGWKVFYAWAMGPNFNIKFRLVGPWAIPGTAKGIMENELFNVVKRTGGLVFFTTYTVLPMIIFGFLSVLLGCINLISPMHVISKAFISTWISPFQKKSKAARP